MLNTTTEQFEKNFPSNEYDKKEWNFTKQELAQIMTYHTIKTLGEMSGLLIEQMINNICLPRIGVIRKKGVGTLYDHQQGTFTVWLPKFYCEVCKEAPAKNTYNERKFCDKCLELVQLKEKVAKEHAMAMDKEKSN